MGAATCSSIGQFERECGAITTWLVERGVRPGSRLLDAGCGTGRYVAELGRRRYVVHGIDASPDPIREARRSLGEDLHTVSVTVETFSPP